MSSLSALWSLIIEDARDQAELWSDKKGPWRAIINTLTTRTVYESSISKTWDQFGTITAQTPGKTRVWQTPESRTSQQLGFSRLVCKTSISGSNPDGASIFH